MDKTVLVIKTDMLLKKSTVEKLRNEFIRQIEEGCVIIPAWFECEVVQVPENVEVIIEAQTDTPSFLDNNFNVKEDP